MALLLRLLPTWEMVDEVAKVAEQATEDCWFQTAAEMRLVVDSTRESACECIHEFGAHVPPVVGKCRFSILDNSGIH